MTLSGRVRSDRRCGPEFPLDDGEPSECDGSTEVETVTIPLLHLVYTEPLLLQLGLLRPRG